MSFANVDARRVGWGLDLTFWCKRPPANISLIPDIMIACAIEALTNTCTFENLNIF